MLITLEQQIDLLKRDGNYKPHKHLALLTMITCFERKGFTDNCLCYDEDFKRTFSGFFKSYSNADDRDRSYTPYFHLRSLPFWILVPNTGKEEELRSTSSIGGPSQLMSLVSHVVIQDEVFHALKDSEYLSFVKQQIVDILKEYHANMNDENGQFSEPRQGDSISCGFCYYLNTLISTNPCNENAIAETQSVNDMFNTIHIEHPLVTIIAQDLKKNLGKHIILTGHAGDGKTTIAIDILQSLKGLETGHSLAEPLLPREDVDDPKVSILKDFSERAEQADLSLIEELKAFNRRFLIISNTGALLSFFREHAINWDISPVQAESKILTAISADGGFNEVEFSGIEFIVFNLARMDNLDLAKAIFIKMIQAQNWEGCGKCSKKGYCPIKLNINLIQSLQDQVVDRLFLIYKRLHEYGNRLTIRQITSHLAYMLSGGLNCDSIHEGMVKLGTEYLFFNRMFGDNGKLIDFIASEMKAIVEIRRQAFGELLNSNPEMNLWLRPVADTSLAVHSSVGEVFSRLRRIGMSSLTADDTKISPENARMQVRRLLYFFIQGESESKDVISAFLKSPNILHWQKWQKDGAFLDNAYKTRYANMIYHVIQEYFTGIRIPEGIGYQDGRLYITLSRKQSEVKQSAQIVIAEFDWSQSISLEIVRDASAIGKGRAELALVGKGVLQGINLKLGLPFLDYVTQRHYGEIGELLKASYRERLEQFKTQILGKTAYGKDEMMIVRLRNNNMFKRQKYVVKSRFLEVYDV